ncbi:EFR1 family ferrodoxin [Paraclostridium sordellii]
MSTIIYYFTGTGNSLMLARNLGNILDAKLVSIANVINNPINIEEAEVIGFIFPLYYQTVPIIVQDFIKKLDLKDKYIFAIVNSGAYMGISLDVFSDILKENKSELSAGFQLIMPYNFLIDGSRLGELSFKLKNIIFKRADKKLIKIAKIINSRKKIGIERRPYIKKHHPYSHFSKEELEKCLKEEAKYFWVNEKCISCGQCKKVCPVNNIEIINKFPIWDNKCEQCLACISWCPVKAIEFEDRTYNQMRYRNPNVTIRDIIDSSP